VLAGEDSMYSGSDMSYQLSEIGRAISVSVNMVAVNAEATHTMPAYTATRRRLKPGGINHQ